MSNRPFKRARTNFAPQAKRPIDKSLINIAKTLSGTTQAETVLTTATFPCTVTGLRWEINGVNDQVADEIVRWAIILVKDGNSANAIGASDGSTFYEPEQNVLAWGVLGTHAASGPMLSVNAGTTKSMRKLMGGDRILFIVKGDANAPKINGCVQFFCKV